MLSAILIPCVLVGITVIVHAAGFDVLLRILLRTNTLNVTGPLPVTGVLMCVTLWLILLHVAEIAIWGLFYLWWDCLPDLESALYFSGATYTTVGYGDVVLPKPWRLLAPLEALTGILMCGLSIGLFFALVNHRISRWIKQQVALDKASAPTDWL